jgi:hypothetical protein
VIAHLASSLVALAIIVGACFIFGKVYDET